MQIWFIQNKVIKISILVHSFILIDVAVYCIFLFLFYRSCLIMAINLGTKMCTVKTCWSIDVLGVCKLFISLMRARPFVVHVCTLLKIPDCSNNDSMMLNIYIYVTVILTSLDGWLQPLYSISHLQKGYTIYLHSIWRGIINQYQICSITVFARIKLSFTLSRCFDVI